MFWQRLLTVIVGVPIAVWVIIRGSWWLVGAVALIVVWGQLELAGMFARLQVRSPGRSVMIAGGLAIVAGAYTGAVGENSFTTGGIFAALALCLLAWSCLSRGHGVQAAAVSLFAWVYWGYLPAHLIFLREMPDGLAWVLLAVMCTWANDIGAYVVGCSIGRTKLAPDISPNKSVEGAAAGVVCSSAAACGVGQLLDLPLPVLAGLGAAIAAAGQIGDLVESALKREAGVKDSGRVLPGHGGILDRFDSLAFVAPMVYYLARWF